VKIEIFDFMKTNLNSYIGKSKNHIDRFGLKLEKYISYFKLDYSKKTFKFSLLSRYPSSYLQSFSTKKLFD